MKQKPSRRGRLAISGQPEAVAQSATRPRRIAAFLFATIMTALVSSRWHLVPFVGKSRETTFARSITTEFLPSLSTRRLSPPCMFTRRAGRTQRRISSRSAWLDRWSLSASQSNCFLQISRNSGWISVMRRSKPKASG